MAIFSTRSSKRDADEAPQKNVPIDSIATLRTRARQRLIGAVVLVALGIISFTLLFDSQPRPIPVDIQITMPDKDKPDSTVTSTATVKPAAAPATTTAPAPTATAPDVPAAPAVATPAAPPAPAAPAVAATAAAAVAASASLGAKEEIVASKPAQAKKPETKPEVKPAPAPISKPEVKPEAKPIPAAKPAVDESAKAMAILEGKDPVKVAAASPKPAASTAAAPANESAGRFVVQVGAFADKDKAQQVRLKVERAGMKTYTHVAVTKEGARTRVRVGPFATRAEAEKVAAKIKSLDLPAGILTL